ncbi:MAG: response regulator transcription factor [Coriobacteriia bacterium]|nr:response regulator transcription factor [Coriobacteriia bacterium]MCL2745704.1 response regulator transcription factor [Coriobacteriia bacterium]MCL2870249.1 response regulator transcription factor [Coriobacteriia bacterium]
MKQKKDTHEEPRRILLIEDDFAIRNSVEFALRREGFNVKTLESGKEAVSAVLDFNPDLILLDIMLPSKSGHDICEELRQAGNDVAIIMISALGETTDRIAGLRLGADDYVSKPFSLDELLMRVHANLRRSSRSGDSTSQEKEEKPAKLHFFFSPSSDETSPQNGESNSELIIDPAKHEVSIDGTVLPLRAKEFALLYMLASRPQEALTRKELSEKVWGQDYLHSSRTIDVHIRRLRALLADCGASHYLRTIHGVGYRFEADAEASK